MVDALEKIKKRDGGVAGRAGGAHGRVWAARKRDETVQVAPAGFGQHENPICERPRCVAAAITSSNFVLMLLSQ
jgi:hypothetical protein